mmetsp:Transcript_39823/g.63720  ORF Transcript_39823/g.63720 Transcript_39823/m.63720 type:complete len:292 (+) Transcript_39823:212-1087(+)
MTTSFTFALALAISGWTSLPSSVSAAAECSISTPCKCLTTSLTTVETTSDCENTCWNHGSGAGKDGYAVNSWKGHYSEPTTTMELGPNNDTYTKFIVFHPPDNGVGFGEYALNEEYSTFTGTIGQARSNNNGGCAVGMNWHVAIKVDGTVEFESRQFTNWSQTEEFVVDVSGATTLRLESHADGDWVCDWATIVGPNLIPTCDQASYGSPQMDVYRPQGEAQPDPRGIVLDWTSSSVGFIAGVLALLLVVNLVMMAYVNCCGGKNGRTRYQTVKMVDSDVEALEAEPINIQ